MPTTTSKTEAVDDQMLAFFRREGVPKGIISAFLTDAMAALENNDLAACYRAVNSANDACYFALEADGKDPVTELWDNEQAQADRAVAAILNSKEDYLHDILENQ